VSDINRRQFVQKAGIGAAAAGAVWVAPSVIGLDTAFAGSSCLSPQLLDFTGNTVGSQPLTWTVGTYTVTLTITPVNAPTGGNPATPQISNTALAGSGTSHYYRFSMANGTVANPAGYDIHWHFSKPVFALAFTILEIDKGSGGNHYQDVVWLGGTTSSNAPPTINPTVGSEVGGGPGTSQATAWTGTAQLASGTNTTGNVRVLTSPQTQAVSDLTVAYRSGSATGTNQWIGITNLSWC